MKFAWWDSQKRTSVPGVLVTASQPEPEAEKPLLTPEEPKPPVKHHRYPATTRCPRKASTEQALFYYTEQKIRAQKQESRANIKIKQLLEKQRKEQGQSQTEPVLNQEPKTTFPQLERTHES